MCWAPSLHSLGDNYQQKAIKYDFPDNYRSPLLKKRPEESSTHNRRNNRKNTHPHYPRPIHRSFSSQFAVIIVCPFYHMPLFLATIYDMLFATPSLGLGFPCLTESDQGKERAEKGLNIFRPTGKKGLSNPNRWHIYSAASRIIICSLTGPRGSR